MPRRKKHASGQYEVKATIGHAFDGSLIRKSFYGSTRAEAKQKAQEFILQKEMSERTGSAFISHDVTFAKWARQWLKSYKKPTVSVNTYKDTYENTVEKHLIPYFKDASLTDIKPLDIQDFFAVNRQRSASSLKKMRMCLNAIFETAIDNDICYKNPVKNVTWVSDREANKKQVYTDEQIDWVINYALNDSHPFPDVVVLLETGLRRGELVGLKWDDVDLEHHTLSVNRSLSESRENASVIENEPKWGSYRTIPLSPRIVEVLQKLPRYSEYVFPNRNGDAYSPNTWSRKLTRYMRTMHQCNPNVPILSAHELRHTHGTALRRRGVDIYTIQKLLGHKDIKITSEIYVHNETDTLKKALGYE